MLHCSGAPFLLLCPWSAVKDKAELKRWKRRETKRGILLKSNPAPCMNWKFSWQKYLISQSGQGNFPLNRSCFQDMEGEEEERTRTVGENQETAPAHTTGSQVWAIVQTLLEKLAQVQWPGKNWSHWPGIPEDFLTQESPFGPLCPSNVFSQTEKPASQKLLHKLKADITEIHTVRCPFLHLIPKIILNAMKLH